KPGGLEAGHPTQKPCRLWTPRTVSFTRNAKAVQDEYLPLVSARNILLIGRDLVEGRQAVPALQQILEFSPDRLPISLNLGEERESARVMHRVVRDEALPRHQIGNRLDEATPPPSHQAAPNDPKRIRI